MSDDEPVPSRREVLSTASIILAVPSLAASSNMATERRSASLADFRGGVGRGSATADTEAFISAAAALSAGEIARLTIPRGRFELASPFDVDAPPLAVSIEGQGPAATEIVTTTSAGQNAFVVRNTVRGTTVRKLRIRSLASASTYQHGPVFANVSNLLVEDFLFEDSQGYGLGIFEDVIAPSGQRTNRPCDNIAIRNGVIRNASQYGIQHFPKVRSENALFSNLQLINCGRNTQRLAVPSSILPSAIKVGQATRNTTLRNIRIVCANGAAGLDIGNYEDLMAEAITIENPVRQAIAISVSRHPALIDRLAGHVGGPSLPPYVTGHHRVSIRDVHIVHDAQEAGGRKAAAISFASDQVTSIGTVEIAYSMRGDVVDLAAFTASGFTAAVHISPGTALTDFSLTADHEFGRGHVPAEAILITNAAGGSTIRPRLDLRVRDPYPGPTTVLRGALLIGVKDPILTRAEFHNVRESVVARS